MQPANNMVWQSMPRRQAMIVEKTPEKQCEDNVKRQRLTQVKQYKYLGATVEHTGQCKTEVADRINQAKIAFCKKVTILRSYISMKITITIILMCYLFSVVSYGCETWTYSKAIDHKINAIEMWCYRIMFSINWTSHTINIFITTDNWCKGCNVKQPEKRKVVLWAT